MHTLPKVQRGDKVAILSPSFAAPGKWPEVHALGLSRVREIFGLEPVEYPTTRMLGASGAERAHDLISAFTDPSIKAVIASIGGDDQVTYIKNLPHEPFMQNPKPFFGYSDNSHFCNFLFLCGVPSFYGGSLFTQFAMQGGMDAFTVEYITHALFKRGEYTLTSSPEYTDQGLSWDNPENLKKRRTYWSNDGWKWNGVGKGEGLLWGGCIESVDEMIRHGVPIPNNEQFENIVLMLESSEEMPSADYVFRVMRALGERGILTRVKGVLVGRAKAWEFDKPYSFDEKIDYRKAQQSVIARALEQYNPQIPLVQNLDFGHTDPQIPMPYGGRVYIDSVSKEIRVTM